MRVVVIDLTSTSLMYYLKGPSENAHILWKRAQHYYCILFGCDGGNGGGIPIMVLG